MASRDAQLATDYSGWQNKPEMEMWVLYMEVEPWERTIQPMENVQK